MSYMDSLLASLMGNQMGGNVGNKISSPNTGTVNMPSPSSGPTGSPNASLTGQKAPSPQGAAPGMSAGTPSTPQIQPMQMPQAQTMGYQQDPLAQGPGSSEHMARIVPQMMKSFMGGI